MANSTTKHSTRIADTNARTLVGRKVLYIGNMACPRCGLNRRKGMVSEYRNNNGEGGFYCSEDCVLATVANGG